MFPFQLLMRLSNAIYEPSRIIRMRRLPCGICLLTILVSCTKIDFIATWKNGKIAGQHFLSLICPFKLWQRLESDIFFSHIRLKKDFKSFFAYAQKISEACALVNNRVMAEENINIFKRKEGKGNMVEVQKRHEERNPLLRTRKIYDSF